MQFQRGYGEADDAGKIDLKERFGQRRERKITYLCSEQLLRQK
jgi:hypothetical protein